MTKKPILRGRDGDYDIYTKNDGVDYWRIVRACIDENIDQAELIREKRWGAKFAIDRNGVRAEATALVFVNPKRLVLKVETGAETGGRKFILKRAYMGTPGFKRLLPGVIGLTYFTRIMKLVNRAVANGCAATQDYFLVAERRAAPFRSEVWVLIEYLEGRGLDWFGAKGDCYFPALAETARELLRHNLTMDDAAPGNFIVDPENPDSVRAIDLSCRPFPRLQKASMTWKLNRLYGLDLPVAGVLDKLLYALANARYRNDKRFQQSNKGT